MGYAIKVRNRIGLIEEMLRAFKQNVAISFEGDLQSLNLQLIPGSSTEETPPFRRNTYLPIQDFIIVPINEENIVHILRQLKNVGGADWENIIHIEIAKDDEIFFSACDNFHEDCTIATAAISVVVLEKLKVSGVISSYIEELG